MSRTPTGGRFDLDRLIKEFAESDEAERLEKQAREAARPDDRELSLLARGALPRDRAREIRALVLFDADVARRYAAILERGAARRAAAPRMDASLMIYFRDAAPPGTAGRNFRARADALIAEDPSLADDLDVVAWTENGALNERLAWMQEAFAGDAGDGGTAGFPFPAGDGRTAESRSPVGRRAERLAPGDTIEALLLSPGGTLVLDSEGEPRTAMFTVQTARITPRRGLFVRLRTSDESIAGMAPAPLVRLSLRDRNRFVELPETEMDPAETDSPHPARGVTIRARALSFDVARIPARAFVLTVRRRSEDTPDDD